MAEMQRQQSMRELKYLNNFQHDNILPLYGYSTGGERPCLVYKFMSNGSLEDRIQCRVSFAFLRSAVITLVNINIQR